MRKIKHEFITHWKNYIVQSLLAGLIVFVVMLVLTAHEAVVIASIGASSFLVFAMPDKLTSQPKNVLGGYVIGLACGALFSFYHGPNHYIFSASHAFAVAASIFFMVVLDFEHPPASGVALAISIDGLSSDIVFTVLFTALVLAMAHRFFSKSLRDLT